MIRWIAAVAMFVIGCALPESAPSAAEPGVSVCVGADRVLRHTARGACADGQQAYRLSKADSETDKADEKSIALDALRRQVAEMSARIKALENRKASAPSGDSGPASVRLKAPFEVLDEDGAVIFRVQDKGASSRGAFVHNAQGAVVAQLGVFDESQGGRVAVYSKEGDGSKHLALLWNLEGAWVSLRRSDAQSLLTVNEKDGLTVYNKRGVPAVAMNTTSGGSVVVNTNEGRKRASLDQWGASYYHSNGKATARLGGVDAEGGQLLLGNPSGKPVAKLFSNNGGNLHVSRPDGSDAAHVDSNGVSVFNSSGQSAAHLILGPGEAGVLQLFDSGGDTMVEAGKVDGVGTVRVGPKYRCMAMAGPTVMVGGVPDCLKGKLQ